MTIVADRDCRMATVTGSLQWKIKEVDSIVRPEPNRYILGIEGTRVLSFESRDIDEVEPRLARPWHRTPMVPVEGARFVEIPAPFWPDSLERAEFRLRITAAQPAGFHSCYLTSPGIDGRIESVDPRPAAVATAAETFAGDRHDSTNLGNQIALDAVMEMTVPGQESEAAVVDAAVASQPGQAVTSCSNRETGRLTVEGEIDRFAQYRQSRTKRPCAGVQRFQSRNVQASITKYTYLSGILLSAGMVMFLDTIMGATAALASQAGRRIQTTDNRS